VLLEPAVLPTAVSVTLAALADTIDLLEGNLLPALVSSPSYDLTRMPLQPGTILPVFALHRVIEFVVQSCDPSGPVVVNSSSQMGVAPEAVARPKGLKAFDVIGYDSIGGMDSEISELRSEIEWPLTQPHIFEALGLCPHKAILLTGPHGCGKSLLTRALRAETPFHVEYVRGLDTVVVPAVTAVGLLRRCVDRAIARPSIVCFDDIDLISEEQLWPNGSDRRLSIALLGAIDRLLGPNGALAIIGTTSGELSPELRSRFTKNIVIARPEGEARTDIVRVMLRGVASLRGAAQVAAGLTGVTGAEMKLEIERILARAALQRLHNLADKGATTVPVADAEAVTLDAFVAASGEARPRVLSGRHTKEFRRLRGATVPPSLQK
jgi:SpoVK/Ycf46/Vps4 family AAA+-type ATPase